MPVSQNFGTTTFTSAPTGFACWTSGSSPSGTQSNAENSTPAGDATITVATGTQTTGGCYGYATSSNGRLYIQTSSNATNGTNQLAAAIDATGFGNIVVSYDIEMISANPRTIGVELQYRVGTSGSWTSVSGTVYSHTSSDRSNGNVDNFSVTLPSGAENNSVVQLRWITWRGSQTGNSSGIAIDNISISGTALQTYYFRSKQSGAWNSASTWESSPDNSTWTNATIAPKYTANTVTIQSGDSVSITASDTIDQVVVNGILAYENVGGSTPTINNGTGADLTINGKFYDAGPNSITWLSGATWSMGSNGYLIRNRGTSTANWRDKYDGGISNIPATAYWIVRKNSSDTPLLSSTGGAYYPNLKIENYTVSGWTTGTNSSFSGSSNSPIVKGSLYIGGDGSNTVSFLNSNTYTNPVLVYGNLTLKSGSTMRCQGTGYEVQGDIALNGTMDYTGGGAFVIKLTGSANQNLSGTLNMNNLELNKTSTNATVTLQSAATISGGLSFVKGYLISSSTNVLTFKHHSSVGNAGGANTNDSSFVRGPVKKIGNSAFTFPIGKGSNYQSIRISAPTDSTDAFTAEYFDTAQTLGSTTDPTFDYVSSCEYFNLSRTTGTSTVSVTLAVDMSSCVTNLFPDPRVIGWDGSKWADLGQGSFSFSTFGGTIVSDGPLSNYGAITLGNNSNGTTLPPDTASIPSSFRYVKNNGQLIATNDSLRPDIKYYMNDAYPKAYLGNDTLHYVFAHIDTVSATTDTMVRVDVTYLNSNSTFPVAQHVDSTYTNYFFAHCPDGVVNVPQYQRLTYGKLYQNIDLVYAQNAAGIKYAFDMRAGAKADVIRARYSGTDSVKVLGSGELSIYTILGNLTFNAPHAFQVDSSGNTVSVSCDWYVDNDTEVIFTFPIGYNQHLPLAIIVEQNANGNNSAASIENLEWSTFYGGSQGEELIDITTDAVGNSYTTGATHSTNFPITPGVFQEALSSQEDVIVIKFDATTLHNTWATYYGGTGKDNARGISVDANQEVYVAGYTFSSDFPVYNPIQSYGFGGDGFVFKLNSTGTARGFATTYGGSGQDEFHDVVVDGSGHVFAVGKTFGTVPLTAQTGTTSYSSGQGVILKLSSSTGATQWATQFGGTFRCDVNGVEVDQSDNIFLTGTTRAAGFVQTNPNFTHAFGGTGSDVDAFITKLDATHNNIVWSSFYGGNGVDVAKKVAVNSNGDVAFVGGTVSTSGFPVLNYPTGGNSYGGDAGLNSGDEFGDGFIAVFSNDGHHLFGTYYGGSSNEECFGVCYDAGNRLYVTGYTATSTNTFLIPSPNATGAYAVSSITGLTDAFISCFNTSYNQIWGTYFGGNEGTTSGAGDTGYGIAAYQNSKLYTVGVTTSIGQPDPYHFPLVNFIQDVTYYQEELNGNNLGFGASDGYVSRFDLAAVISTGVENEQGHNNSNIVVFPNPGQGQFNLEINKIENKKKIFITVYDILGKAVYSEKISNPVVSVKKVIDLSHFSSGMYILKVQMDDEVFSKKMIKN